MWMGVVGLVFLLVLLAIDQEGDFFYRLCNHNRPHPRSRPRPSGGRAGRTKGSAFLS